MLLYKICQVLNDQKIPYAIVGGHAVALHGAIRATIDIDLIIKWELKTLLNLEKALKSLGLISRLPLDAKDLFNFRKEYITKRNLIAWNFYNPQNLLEQIDIIITHDLKNLKVKNIKTSNGIIKILSKKDLIKMKKDSGREQDLVDIKALESLED